MSELRVGLVTTWGTSCGIATYSEELAAELAPRVGYLQVFSEAGPGAIARRDRGGELPVEPSWSRYQPSGNAALIAAGVSRKQLDVLHIQHEHGLWPNDAALAETLRAARAAGAVTVVTLHTVFPVGGYLHPGTLQLLARAADVVIVHGRQARAVLLAAGAASVVEVSHGTALRCRGDRNAGLEWFGVPASLRDERFVWGLIFGFQALGKNIISTLRSYAVGRATKQIRGCGLLIAGEIKDETYGLRVNGIALEGGYVATLFKRDGFVDAAQRDDVFAAADFGVLNHLVSQPAVLSTSGQVHVAASYALPLAHADCPIYDDARSFGVPFQVNLASPESPSMSCANAIAALAGSRELRAGLGEQARAFAEATRWAKIAEQTTAAYEEAVAKRAKRVEDTRK